MKAGTKVKVVSCIKGHEFYNGEIVERYYTDYDNEGKDSLAFIGNTGQ